MLAVLAEQPMTQQCFAATRLRELEERAMQLERRGCALDDEIAAGELAQAQETEIRATLAAFDPVWEVLTPREQERVIHLLVARVEYDGLDGTLSITVHPTTDPAGAAEERVA